MINNDQSFSRLIQHDQLDENVWSFSRNIRPGFYKHKHKRRHNSPSEKFFEKQEQTDKDQTLNLRLRFIEFVWILVSELRFSTWAACVATWNQA